MPLNFLVVDYRSVMTLLLHCRYIQRIAEWKKGCWMFLKRMIGGLTLSKGVSPNGKGKGF